MCGKCQPEARLVSCCDILFARISPGHEAAAVVVSQRIASSFRLETHMWPIQERATKSSPCGLLSSSVLHLGFILSCTRALATQIVDRIQICGSRTDRPVGIRQYMSCEMKSVPGECDSTVCARLCHARAFGFGWRFGSLTRTEFECLELCSQVTHTCRHCLQFEASTSMLF